MPTTVCLNMIVKNEAHVIRRCLDSLRAFVDYWVIVDTGSTDGTQDIIRSHFADVPGELHERPWRNFGHNRTEALDLARGKADYIFIMDADNIFHAPEGWKWPQLAGDAYYMNLRSSGLDYSQCIFVSDRLRWRYVGVLHEYVTSDAPHKIETLVGPWIDRRHEGARSRDPDNFRKDAAILEKALVDEPGNTRYAFYLGQSWRDAHELEKARDAYRRRAAMPHGWDEETFCALYEIARLDESLQASVAEIQGAYLAAYQFRPRRAEPLYQLARFHRERKEFALAYLFAKRAVHIPRPADLLFVDDAVYRWRNLDELSVAASYVDALDEGRQLTERLLAEGNLPASERPRVEANLAFFLSKASRPVEPKVSANYSICIIEYPGYVHSRVFADVALGLQEGFAELGEIVPIVHDPKHIAGRGVILGANLLPSARGVAIPDDAIVFNLEQMSETSGWITEAYLDVLRSHEVWDYSEYNIAILASKGVKRIRRCGIGYAPCLSRIAPARDEDIDVLFYGAISGRRIPIIESIEATGLRVRRLFNVYGAERDTWTARARIVLNLHAHPEEVFEIVRISYLLANRRFVLSEPGRGSDSIEAHLREGIAYGRASELPDLCRRYVADSAARQAVANRGFDLFRATRQADSLRTALDPETQERASP